MALDGLNILVTGGTGSFGQAFCEFAATRARSVTVYSRDELKQSEMHVPGLKFVIGDIRDLPRLTAAMAGIDVVVHAAAMKQVPACEDNPTEAIDSNVTGSRNVIDAANGAGVSLVVALSTDKAANPTNTYGATKMLAERLFLTAKGPTRFCVVRCGNIFGSRGSVVPLFREQANTGTVTVTDSRMTRYSITLTEAVAMVVRAIHSGRGGEMFIPKMPSYRLSTLAAAIAPECTIREIGPRAGESSHECLITEAEAPDARDAGAYWVVAPGQGDGQVKAAYSDGNARWLTMQELRAL